MEEHKTTNEILSHTMTKKQSDATMPTLLGIAQVYDEFVGYRNAVRAHFRQGASINAKDLGVLHELPMPRHEEVMAAWRHVHPNEGVGYAKGVH
jgi:hypothetical protein